MMMRWNKVASGKVQVDGEGLGELCMLKFEGATVTQKGRVGGVTYNGLLRKALPKRGIFFRLQVHV